MTNELAAPLLSRRRRADPRGDPRADPRPALRRRGPERAAAGDPTPEAAAGAEHPDQHGAAAEAGGAAAPRTQPL